MTASRMSWFPDDMAGAPAMRKVLTDQLDRRRAFVLMGMMGRCLDRSDRGAVTDDWGVTPCVVGRGGTGKSCAAAAIASEPGVVVCHEGGMEEPLAQRVIEASADGAPVALPAPWDDTYDGGERIAGAVVRSLCDEDVDDDDAPRKSVECDTARLGLFLISNDEPPSSLRSRLAVFRFDNPTAGQGEVAERVCEEGARIRDYAREAYRSLRGAAREELTAMLAA